VSRKQIIGTLASLVLVDVVARLPAADWPVRGGRSPGFQPSDERTDLFFYAGKLGWSPKAVVG
jgi:hypothetical protein